MSESPASTRERIMNAAFDAFMRLGFNGASTAEIARIARVSKRDLYAAFPNKQAMLAACVTDRTERMRQPLALPPPASREALRMTLIEFGVAIMMGLSRPEVLATYRLAVAEAENAPGVAQTLDRLGRAEAAEALSAMLRITQANGLLRAGDAAAMAETFLAHLNTGAVLVRMLMRLIPALEEPEARARAVAAAGIVLTLYGAAGEPAAPGDFSP